MLVLYAYAIYISVHLSYENPSAKKKHRHNFVIPSVIPISALQINKQKSARWVQGGLVHCLKVVHF